MIESVRIETEWRDLLPEHAIRHRSEADRRREVEEVSGVVQEILDAYEHQGGINYTGGDNLPSQQHIVDITEALRMLLFPGYYDRGAIDEAALPYIIGERVTWIYKHLNQEINRCLCFACREAEGCCNISECEERSRRITLDLLRALPDLRAQLKLDVVAAVEGDPAANSASEVILAYPSIAAITVHRLAHFLQQRQVPLLPRIMSEYIHHWTGIDIHPAAQIGSSFFIDHGTGVVIGETTQIGDRVKLYQGVTLGSLSVHRDMRGHKRHPTIEDDVTIYSGATILGGETVIGRGSIIGGNVWVVSSVPPYSKVYNARSSSEPIVSSS